jgi:hypothetical protein
MITDHDIIKEISRELGSELTPGERDWLETQRILHQRRVCEITSATVAEKVRQIRKAFQSKQVDVPKASFSGKDRGGKASQSRMRAISQIVAQDAANDAGVKKFRKEILKDRLLARDKIEVWIKQQELVDGPFTIFLKIPLPRNNKIDYTEDGIVPQQPVVVGERWPARGTQMESLDYPGPVGYVRSVAVFMDGVLNDLRYLSETLAGRYGWQPGQATEFVLTGATPAISSFEVGVKMRMSIPALSRVTLTVDPTLSPREVAEYYRQYRQQVLGRRHRSLSEKHTALALFMSFRPLGETYAEAMKAWNKEYRKWRYGQETNFGRDAQVARRRLLTPGQLGWNLLGAKEPTDPDELELLKSLGRRAPTKR